MEARVGDKGNICLKNWNCKTRTSKTSKEDYCANSVEPISILFELRNRNQLFSDSLSVELGSFQSNVNNV